ncbi:MAG TPA: sigma-70 family RNA polymerase sigma factor [Rhizomicrobium sp.]
MSVPQPPPVMQPQSPETITLIVRAIAGNREAVEALIARYQGRVARFVIAQTADMAHYEDLCQTVFVKMVLALPRLRSAERFEPWLFQIARNACRDHLRTRRIWRRMFVAHEPQHDAVAAAEIAPDRADAEKVARSIERLPQAQRELLKLSLDGRRSYEELAELARAGVSAVKSRLHRARENLRVILLAGDAE